ncbi:MAG: branched-chain amino acid ABC transporter permease [Thermoleophilia bacterium]
MSDQRIDDTDAKLLPDGGGRSRRKLILAGLAALGVLFFATLPFYYDVHNGQFGVFFFNVFVYVIVAQGWNLVSGYTGQISLGQNAFFGVGAYTMALLWFNDVTKTGYYFDPVLMILAGVAPFILAVLVGVPLLSRLRGDYFAFGTLGMGMIVTVLFINGGMFTGGAEGRMLVPKMPEGVVFNLRTHYWVALLVAVLATLVVYFMTASRIGLALRAIREDEVSAASHGVNVLKYKVMAFAVGAFMAGVAGSIYGYYLLQVTPSNVLTSNWLFLPILMVVLGGTGTILGPWLGAFVIYLISWYGDSYFAGYHPIISGVVIIAVMLFLPSGLMGLGQKVPGLRKGGGGSG